MSSSHGPKPHYYHGNTKDSSENEQANRVQ